MINRVSSLQLSNFQRKLDCIDGKTGSNPQQSKREHEKEISRKTDRCLKQVNKFSVYCTDLTQLLSQKDNQVKKLGCICYSIWPGFACTYVVLFFAHFCRVPICTQVDASDVHSL